MADSLGARLRQKREALGLSLEDVEGRICIRAKHLAAIESDNLIEFASAAQAKGFIRTYALFLDVPFDTATHPIGATRPARPAPMVVFPPSIEQLPVPKRQVPYDGMPKPVSGPRRTILRWFRMEVLVIILAALMVLGLFAWGVNTMIVSTFSTPTATSSPQTTPTGTLSNFESSQTMLASAASVSSATPSAAPTAVPGVPSTPRPTLYPTPQGGVYSTVHIRLLVMQSAFLKVEVDGKAVFNQRVLEGDSFEFEGKRIVSVSTGNAAGIQAYYNGVDQGIFGTYGEIASRTWNLSGLVQVASSPTATPKTTPSVTSTSPPPH